MSWESRSGTGRYYTQSRRVDGKVQRIYLGNGPGVEQLAAEDAKRHTERLAQQQAARERHAPLNAVNDSVENLVEHMDLLVSAVLTAHGYHKHGGEWRKRRA